MNVRRIVLISLVSSLAAMAQTAPPSHRAAPARSVKKAAPVARKAKSKAAPRPQASPAKDAAAKTPARIVHSVARRDPFVSPIREVAMGGPGCNVGKKCLSPDMVVLRGIATTPNGSIAVVENPRTRPTMTYFLRENDPVFNGIVVKITPDSIVFRENVMDRLGNQTTRDIVKKVAPSA